MVYDINYFGIYSLSTRIFLIRSSVSHFKTIRRRRLENLFYFPGFRLLLVLTMDQTG